MSMMSTIQKQQRSLRAGFTLVELLVIVAVIGIVSGIGLTTMASFLQEQRLRQAAFELASYLQSARARAQRDGAICQLEFEGTTIKPSSSTNNRCYTGSPRLPDLNLAAVSGTAGLTIERSTTDSITFTPAGSLAFPSNDVFYKLIIYLGAPNTNVQRCVYLDLLSIYIGYRNDSNQSSCNYTKG